MVDAATYTAGCLLLAFACYRIAGESRGGPPDPGTRYICGFALSLGTALLVLAPSSMDLLNGLECAPQLGVLAGAELKLAALTFLALLARSLGPPGHEPHSTRGPVVRSAAAQSALAVLFVLAHLRYEAGSGRFTPGGSLLLAAYDLLFLGYAAHCLVVLATLLGRHARRIGPSPLRTGLRLMTASTVVGGAWTLWILSDVVHVLAHGAQDTAEDAPAAVLAVLCAGLAVAGATATWWGGLLAAPGRLLRAHRAHRALEPLWSALHEAHPEIALAPPTAPGRAGGGLGGLRQAEFALYRRVIEIHDGRLSLRPYCPADVSPWLAAHGRPCGTGREAVSRTGGPADAVMEAASIAAGLEARRARGGRPPRGAAAPVLPAARPGTVDADVAWLLSVTEQFRTFVRARPADRAGTAAVDAPGGR